MDVTLPRARADNWLGGGVTLYGSHSHRKRKEQPDIIQEMESPVALRGHSELCLGLSSDFLDDVPYSQYDRISQSPIEAAREESKQYGRRGHLEQSASPLAAAAGGLRQFNSIQQLNQIARQQCDCLLTSERRDRSCSPDRSPPLRLRKGAVLAPFDP